jgi:hypothetical protein
MQRYNNIICISYSELVNGGIITDTSYRYHSQKGNLEVIRKGRNGREALVNYDSMPERYKEKIRRQFGNNIREVATKNGLKDFLEWDVQAEDFFDTYEYENGTKIKPDKRQQYTAIASALNAVTGVMNACKQKRRSMSGTGLSPKFWDEIVEALKAYQAEWGYSLPYSERGLRRKLQEYKAQGYAAIISGKDNNQNAFKTKEMEQQSTLRQILRHPNNLDNEQSAYMYNAIAKERGWKGITAATVAARREEWGLTTAIGRHGEKWFGNNLAAQVKRRGPAYPMLYWTFDGWDVELFYQKTTIDKKGNSVTTYHNRLNLVLVLDAFNNYPMGIAIGEEETSKLIHQALRNAMQHTQQLFGNYTRPIQVQSDRFGVKANTSFLESVSKYYTPAAPGNAKSKIIERYFNYLNKTYFQTCINWSGHNITSRKENQPNSEFKNKHKHLFPDLQGCVKQVLDALAADRKQKISAVQEQWKGLDTYYKLEWNYEQYLYHCGQTSGNTNRMQPDGITLIVNKQEFNYDSFDIDFRRYSHLDWVLKYDTADMRTVLAHSIDGTRRFLLDEKYVQPMALAERKEGDSEQLQKIFNYNEQLKESIYAEIEADTRVVEGILSSDERINDALHKFLITDSKGQHKIHKQKADIKRKTMQLEAKVQRKKEAAEMEQQQSEQVKYWEEKIGDLNEYI